MNQRRHLAVVAGAAVALSTVSLSAVYEEWTWFLYVLLGIMAVVGATIGARAARAPMWLQPLAGLGVLVLFVTAVFDEGAALAGIVPTPGTVTALVAQAQAGFADIAQLAAPVPTRRGLLLLTVLGVGLLTILVDLVAVGLQRAALAGLPLLAMYAVPVAVDRDGLSWWVFAAGAAGYLWLLVTDHIARVARWGRPFAAGVGDRGQPDPLEATPLGSAGRRLGVLGIAVAVLVPVFVPGLSQAGLWAGGSGSGDGLGPGGSRTVETVNPITQLSGELNRGEETELLRLRTTDDAPGYLRTTTLDRYDRNGWSQRELKASRNNRVDRKGKGLPGDGDLAQSVPRRELRSSVEVLGLGGSVYLPLYANPSEVDVEGDWRYEPGTQTVFSARTNTRELKYEFASVRATYEPRQLAASPALDADETLRKRFTEIEPDRAVQGIVDGLVRGKESPYDRVLAISAYFDGEGFRYDTKTKPGSKGSDLADFLDNKVGYCEQYASAMAYMVRAAGVPARVAIGFTRGERQRDGSWRITNYDSHAWVEVYFAGLGWVLFDPTPLAGEQAGRAQPIPYASAPDSAGDTPTPGESGAPGAGTETDDELSKLERQLDREAPADQVAPGSVLEGGRNPFSGVGTNSDPVTTPARWPWYAGGAAVLLLALVVPSLRRGVVRRRRARTAGGADPVAAAHAAWDEVLDTLTDLRSPVDDADTPRTAAARVGRTLHLETGVRAALGRLATAEERARYAPAAVPGEGLPEAVRTVNRGLLASVDRGARLRARLLPASVLGSASLATGVAAERMSSALGRARDAVLRRVAPRRAAAR